MSNEAGRDPHEERRSGDPYPATPAELRQAVARRLRDGRWLINTGDDKSNEKIHLAAADAAIAEVRKALANNEDMEEAAIMAFGKARNEGWTENESILSALSAIIAGCPIGDTGEG